MTPLKPGIYLQATAPLNDTFFEGAVILITENNSDGAVGFVINKTFERRFNELVEFRHSPAFPLYDGGPVDREHLFFIHRRPELIDGGKPVANGLYTGGDFKKAVTAINNKTISGDQIQIFIGYCGWDAGELEAEVEEGSWMLISDFELGI